ncbi:F-box/FBD/LRR-repeat protein [Striga hermonthica]|uniref:F-box/FBD/LRR-repeat protein n=1 Tax=Striga hermonthica TaxID=68872 RepID=A0A9N7RRA9_STRHE|nr:F-box/FBD/LRR-repeat protein [Striga hermonthica]
MEKEAPSTTKRLKVILGNQCMDSIDRLSSLPDSILHHILSFLPTKRSVQTSILSRRWRHLWAHVPDIEFDCHTDLELDGGKRFSDIIYRVMLQYKVQGMNNFRLTYNENCGGEYQLETCITTAIVRNVKHIYLSIYNIVRLPLCIFTYDSLVDLILFQCGPIPMLGFVRLPALKKLHILDVSYESEFGCLTNLLSGCPVLEELNLVSENVPPCIYHCISSPTLIRLYINTTFWDSYHRERYRLKIDAPALRFLWIFDNLSKDVSFNLMPSLTAADVKLHHGCTPRRVMPCLQSLLPFLGSLCYVTRLQLATGLIELSENVFSAVPVKFPNLFEVTLNTNWRFITYFLENADNLKKLRVHTLDNCSKWWIEPHEVPSCLLSSLRSIRLLRFMCTKQEFQMVGYVLRNAKVLETGAEALVMLPGL